MSSIRRDNLFVVGCQRSGTSVVWAGLTAHPDLAPLRSYDAESGYDPKELYYFRNLFEARRQFASPMYGRSADRQYLRRIIDLTIEHCVEHHGSRTGRFVNAHPRDGLYVAELLEAMPEARIIYVLRHPQEVVWSAIHAPWANADKVMEPEPIRLAARNWREHARMAKRVVDGEFGDSVLLVRHEDLLESPARIATQLAALAGVEEDPAMAAQLSGPTFNSSFRNSAPARELIIETRRAISRANNFRGLVCRTTGREMEGLGYADLGNPPLVDRSIWKSVYSVGS